MTFKFKTDQHTTYKNIQTYLDEAELPVSMYLHKGVLSFEIKKFGTSTLRFDMKDVDEETHLVLKKKSIAWTHKAFMGEVEDQIKGMVRALDGVVA